MALNIHYHTFLENLSDAISVHPMIIDTEIRNNRTQKFPSIFTLKGAAKALTPYTEMSHQQILHEVAKVYGYSNWGGFQAILEKQEPPAIPEWYRKYLFDNDISRKQSKRIQKLKQKFFSHSNRRWYLQSEHEVGFTIAFLVPIAPYNTAIGHSMFVDEERAFLSVAHEDVVNGAPRPHGDILEYTHQEAIEMLRALPISAFSLLEEDNITLLPTYIQGMTAWNFYSPPEMADREGIPRSELDAKSHARMLCEKYPEHIDFVYRLINIAHGRWIVSGINEDVFEAHILAPVGFHNRHISADEDASFVFVFMSEDVHYDDTASAYTMSFEEAMAILESLPMHWSYYDDDHLPNPPVYKTQESALDESWMYENYPHFAEKGRAFCRGARGRWFFSTGGEDERFLVVADGTMECLRYNEALHILVGDEDVIVSGAWWHDPETPSGKYSAWDEMRMSKNNILAFLHTIPLTFMQFQTP